MFALLIESSCSSSVVRTYAPPRVLGFPHVGLETTFVLHRVGRDAFSFPVEPVHPADEPPSQADPKVTLSLRDPGDGSAAEPTLTFSGSDVRASSGEMRLDAGTPYAFESGETLEMNGIRASVERRSTRCFDGRAVCIATTGFRFTLDTIIRLSALGACTVDGLDGMWRATHLVVATAGSPLPSSKLLRTDKLLAAATLPGVTVASYDWIKQSLRAGRFLDAVDYAPSDPAGEARSGVDLRRVCLPGGGHGLLDGVSVAMDVAPGAKAPSADGFAAVVRMAGGDVTECAEWKRCADGVVVACFGHTSRPAGYPGSLMVVDGEGILQALMLRELDLASFVLPDC